jgi:hypothetical protein
MAACSEGRAIPNLFHLPDDFVQDAATPGNFEARYVVIAVIGSPKSTQVDTLVSSLRVKLEAENGDGRLELLIPDDFTSAQWFLVGQIKTLVFDVNEKLIFIREVPRDFDRISPLKKNGPVP